MSTIETMSTIELQKLIEILKDKVYGSGLTWIGSGRHRTVYKNPYTKSVIKIPSNVEGIFANIMEENFYHEYKTSGDKIPKAKCFLENDEDTGLPIIHMECIEPLKYGDNYPYWAHFVDFNQVGYTDNGDIVAYDYSSEDWS